MLAAAPLILLPPLLEAVVELPLLPRHELADDGSAAVGCQPVAKP